MSANARTAAEGDQSGLRRVEKREWWLWGTTVAVTLLLTAGIACSVKLAVDSIVDVFLSNAEEVGKARIVRLDAQHPDYPRYGCCFVQKTGTWVLQ